MELGSGARWRWAAGALLLSVVVMVVVLAAGGGAPAPVPAGLPDSGAVTGWGLPLSRLVADLAGVATMGLLLAAGFLVPSPATVLTRPGFGAVRMAVRAAMVWAVAVAVELWLTVSDILGMPPAQALDATLVRSFVTQIPQGRALLVQLVLALVVAVVARSALTSSRSFLAAVLAGLTLVPPTLTGHSSASGHHDLAVASLVVHVVCASLWVGGLLALVWLATVLEPLRRAASRRACPRTGPAPVLGAGRCVLGGRRALGCRQRLRPAAAGQISSGRRTACWCCSRPWRWLVLGGFGWWHRRHTVEQMERDPRRTRGLFVRVAAVELVVMGATFGLAVGLSRTPTPVTQTIGTTQAEELLGGPLPPAPDFWNVALGLTHEGFMLVVLPRRCARLRDRRPQALAAWGPLADGSRALLVRRSPRRGVGHRRWAR